MAERGHVILVPGAVQWGVWEVDIMPASATKRDIIDALLRRQELPERMGIHEHFWPHICENAWDEQGYDGGDFTDEFDLDLVCVDWFDVPGPRPDMAGTVEETDDTVVSRNAWGAIYKNWKNKAGTPEHIGFSVTAETWAKDYREAFCAMDMRAIARERAPGVAEQMQRRREQGRFVTLSFAYVFEKLRSILGDVCMLESLMLETEFVHDFNRVIADAYLAYYDELFNTIGLPDGIHFYEDLGYTRAPFASPKCHREMIHPYHLDLMALFKGHDLPVILHTCGDFRPHLPAIAESGVDCIQAMEAKTGMNVVDLAKDWKNDLCFMGNLDIRAFESGDREAMRTEIESKTAGMRALRAPYVVMSDHSVPPSVSLADYRYALQCCRDNSAY